VPKLAPPARIKKPAKKMGRPTVPASEYFASRFKKLIKLHELSKSEKLTPKERKKYRNQKFAL
jgi:hypothetical protein